MRRFFNEIKRYIRGGFHPGPKLLRLYPIGYLCNNSCSMCWRTNNVSLKKRNKLISLEEKKLTLSEYRKILTTVPKEVETVEIVGGGEPLLYPQIKELTQMIKEKGVIGSLITNGILLNEKLSNHLLRIKWDKIRISVNASNQNIYKLVSGSDNFLTVINNIQYYLIRRNQLQNKSQFNVLFVIQKSNYKDIYQFAQLMQRISCDGIEFDAICPHKKSMILKNKEIRYATDQLKKIKSNLKIMTNADMIINLYKFHPHTQYDKRLKKYYENKMCLVPTDSMVIDSLGIVHPCCFLDDSGPETIESGDFRKNDNVLSIWKQHEYSQIRNNLRSGKFYNTCINGRCNYLLPEK